MTFDEIQQVPVAAGTAFYRKVGKGPDVLFIHGWPLHGETYRALVARWSRRFTCHVVDLPGAGRSTWNEATPISLPGHAAAVCAVIQARGLGSLALVGHDSGGSVARLVAAEIREQVSALVLTNTEIPGHEPWQVRLLQLVARTPGGLSMLRAALGWRSFRHSVLGFGGCFSQRCLLDGEFHERFVRPLLESRAAWSGQTRLLHAWDWDVVHSLDKTQARITAPAMLIWGSNDPFFPVERARGMLGQWGGGAELRLIERGKLLVHEEFPDALTELALPFLEKSFRGRPANMGEALMELE